MDDYVKIEDVTLVCSTEKAALYRIDGEEYWLPWSCLDEGSVDKDGETGSIYLAEWLAEREGLA